MKTATLIQRPAPNDRPIPSPPSSSAARRDRRGVDRNVRPRRLGPGDGRPGIRHRRHGNAASYRASPGSSSPAPTTSRLRRRQAGGSRPCRRQPVGSRRDGRTRRHARHHQPREREDGDSDGVDVTVPALDTVEPHRHRFRERGRRPGRRADDSRSRQRHPHGERLGRAARCRPRRRRGCRARRPRGPARRGDARRHRTSSAFTRRTPSTRPSPARARSSTPDIRAA